MLKTMMMIFVVFAPKEEKYINLCKYWKRIDDDGGNKTLILFFRQIAYCQVKVVSVIATLFFQEEEG